MRNLNDILTGFLATDFEITLSKSHLALLLLVHHRLYTTESQRQDITEDELTNFFSAIDKLEANDPGASQARARAAISALRRSRMILRSDCGGLSALEPVYSLTGLGRAVAENIARQVQFDKDTLKSILSEAIVRLSEVAVKAVDCRSADDWQRSVTVPLREFIEGAFERVLRYQSSLDVRHHMVREEIFALVQAKADQAIDPCVHLLETSMKTITELRDTLLESIIKTEETTLTILVLARNAEQSEAMAAAQGILKRTTQITEWTASRAEAWSFHYQNVHSFLRHVLRVDPNRQIAERLKNAIRDFHGESPCMQICRERNVQHLNEAFLEVPPQRPTRLREDFVVETTDSEESAGARLAADIYDRVTQRLTVEGTAGLAEILRSLEGVAWHDLHVATGIAMQRLLKTQDVDVAAEFSWTTVRGTAEIQDIQVHHERT